MSAILNQSGQVTKDNHQRAKTLLGKSELVPAKSDPADNDFDIQKPSAQRKYLKPSLYYDRLTVLLVATQFKVMDRKPLLLQHRPQLVISNFFTKSQ
jgi:hypothetical protein